MTPSYHDVFRAPQTRANAISPRRRAVNAADQMHRRARISGLETAPPGRHADSRAEIAPKLVNRKRHWNQKKISVRAAAAADDAKRALLDPTARTIRLVERGATSGVPDLYP